jgi:glutaredoxin
VEITLLTRERCDFCELAKQILQRLSTEFSFSISVVDLDCPAGQELAKRGGILFPPGIFLDEEPFSYGRPSGRRLRQELGRRLGAPRVGQ